MSEKIDYKEIYIFLATLVISVLIILFSGLYKSLSLQNIITGYAVLVSLGIGILSFYYNKANLNLSKENTQKNTETS